MSAPTHSLTAQLLREMAERIRLRCPKLTRDGTLCDECRVDAEDLERVAGELSQDSVTRA